MAVRSANVLARIEPDVKEKAEAILSQLGVPASVVINMLYKQIIMTRSIPFPLSVPGIPATLDEMSSSAFNSMMDQGLAEAKADDSLPIDEVFAELRQGIKQHG